MRRKPALTSEDAEKIVAACKARAAQEGLAVTIAVVDDAGCLLRLDRLDGARPNTAELAAGKARTAALSRRPTLELERQAKERPATLRYPDYLPLQGGLPVVHEGECVGAVGVSGARPEQDEGVARAGLDAL